MPGGLKVSLGCLCSVFRLSLECLPCYALTAIPIHRSALLANSYSALHWHFCSAPTAITLPICSDMWYNNMGWCILVRFPYSDAKGGGSHGNGRCFKDEADREAESNSPQHCPCNILRIWRWRKTLFPNRYIRTFNTRYAGKNKPDNSAGSAVCNEADFPACRSF